VEQLIPDGEEWVPLVLHLRFGPTAGPALRLEGELACLGPLRPGVRFASLPVQEAPELAHAHASFYDRAYFDDKREDVTGKYRRLVTVEAGETPVAVAECRVACFGPSRHAVAAFDRFTTGSGPEPVARPAEGRRLETLVFRNELDFAAHYDGQNVTLDYDRTLLAARARPVETALQAVLAGSAALDHPGAQLYLTKYFTPHVPGEPHFFVKPWALTATPPGWSSLLDGIHGDGYDVLRGIVSTDVFHATPAVFRVHGEGTRIRVAEDAPLLRVIPLPRALLQQDFELRSLA
jgi:hypothetical protein